MNHSIATLALTLSLSMLAAPCFAQPAAPGAVASSSELLRYRASLAGWAKRRDPGDGTSVLKALHKDKLIWYPDALALAEAIKKGKPKTDLIRKAVASYAERTLAYNSGLRRAARVDAEVRARLQARGVLFLERLRARARIDTLSSAARGIEPHDDEPRVVRPPSLNERAFIRQAREKVDPKLSPKAFNQRLTTPSRRGLAEFFETAIPHKVSLVDQPLLPTPRMLRGRCVKLEASGITVWRVIFADVGDALAAAATTVPLPRRDPWILSVRACGDRKLGQLLLIVGPRVEAEHEPDALRKALMTPDTRHERYLDASGEGNGRFTARLSARALTRGVPELKTFQWFSESIARHRSAGRIGDYRSVSTYRGVLMGEANFASVRRAIQKPETDWDGGPAQGAATALGGVLHR
jgi:hypothetical protein